MSGDDKKASPDSESDQSRPNISMEELRELTARFSRYFGRAQEVEDNVERVLQGVTPDAASRMLRRSVDEEISSKLNASTLVGHGDNVAREILVFDGTSVKELAHLIQQPVEKVSERVKMLATEFDEVNEITSLDAATAVLVAQSLGLNHLRVAPKVEGFDPKWPHPFVREELLAASASIFSRGVEQPEATAASSEDVSGLDLTVATLTVMNTYLEAAHAAFEERAAKRDERLKAI